MKPSLKIKKADIAVIIPIVLAAICLLMFSSSQGSATAVITVDGKDIRHIDLSENKDTYTIDLENGVEIEVSGNSIYFTSSDCKGKDCIACGKLSSAGDTAVCIPNKTIIKLTGKSNGTPDAVSY